MIKIVLLLGDITKCDVQAIVNAANTRLRPGAGVDGAIHKAAGPELEQACRTIGGCKTGQAVITPGFKLPAKFVIHTPSPVAEQEHSMELLAQCYKNSLILAQKNGIRSIAFPAIGAGIGGGFSASQAAEIAIETIDAYVSEHPDVFDRIILVAFKKWQKEAFSESLNNIKSKAVISIQ
jgi:O-acetyl-ADP-ribose deacetylase (regulator of RNase III)